MGRRHVHGSSVTKIEGNFPLWRDFYTFHYLSAHTATLPVAHGPFRMLAANVTAANVQCWW
jgi:hypothetical protein